MQSNICLDRVADISVGEGVAGEMQPPLVGQKSSTLGQVS